MVQFEGKIKYCGIMQNESIFVFCVSLLDKHFSVALFSPFVAQRLSKGFSFLYPSHTGQQKPVYIFQTSLAIAVLQQNDAIFYQKRIKSMLSVDFQIVVSFIIFYICKSQEYWRIFNLEITLLKIW